MVRLHDMQEIQTPAVRSLIFCTHRQRKKDYHGTGSSTAKEVSHCDQNMAMSYRNKCSKKKVLSLMTKIVLTWNVLAGFRNQHGHPCAAYIGSR